MKKTIFMAGLVALISFSANAGVKVIGEVNGLKIVRIKSVGVFAPSTTTILYYDPAKPGTIEGVLNHAGGPGVVPACAQAGGIAGGAALLRPARVNNSTESNSGSGSSSSASGTGNSSGGSFTPPGLVNTPGHGHNN